MTLASRPGGRGRIYDYTLPSMKMDYGLPSVDCRVWTAEYGLPSMDCQVWTAECGLEPRTVDFGLLSMDKTYMDCLRWTAKCGLEL